MTKLAQLIAHYDRKYKLDPETKHEYEERVLVIEEQLKGYAKRDATLRDMVLEYAPEDERETQLRYLCCNLEDHEIPEITKVKDALKIKVNETVNH